MKPLPKLTPVQQKLFEREISTTISSPRWFVIFGTLEDDSMDDAGAGDPHLAEIRASGMFTPQHQAIFQEKLSACASAARWFCVFGTLSDQHDLRTAVRCMNFPPAGTPKADLLHVAMERMVFESLRQGEAWIRRLPHDEGLYRAIARGAWEGFEGRKRVGSGGSLSVNGHGGNGGLISAQMNIGGGIVIGHGVPISNPDDPRALPAPERE